LASNKIVIVIEKKTFKFTYESVRHILGGNKAYLCVRACAVPTTASFNAAAESSSHSTGSIAQFLIWAATPIEYSKLF
jgi:hypothetical protein